MNGVGMFGRCEVCGKEGPLTRTYFRIPIKCDCHSPEHFDAVDHCTGCMPVRPTTKITLTMEQAESLVRRINEITALREKVATLEARMPHAEAFALIAAERARQDQKWGYPQLNTYSEWAGILAEECGECCAELNELNFGRGDVVRLIAEAVQVAAVAVSILEHLEPAQDVTLRMAAARVAALEIHQSGLAPAT